MTQLYNYLPVLKESVQEWGEAVGIIFTASFHDGR